MDVRGIDREIRTIHVTPTKDAEGKIQLGVLLGDAVQLDYSQNRQLAGIMHTWNMFSYSTSTLWNLVSLSVAERDIAPVAEGVSGPVGVSGAISGILDLRGRERLVGLIDLTALLSISLAFLNILPFPALDGGRLAFVAVEAAAGKRISHKVEAVTHKWGMAALLALIILVTIKDVRNLF
jgi:regulator of sigma E protease